MTAKPTKPHPDDARDGGAVRIEDRGRAPCSNVRVLRVRAPHEDLAHVCAAIGLDGVAAWAATTPRAELPRFLGHLRAALSPAAFEKVQRAALALLREQIAAVEAHREELLKLMQLAATPSQGRC
jgi:hypothetical protein